MTLPPSHWLLLFTWLRPPSGESGRLCPRLRPRAWRTGYCDWVYVLRLPLIFFGSSRCSGSKQEHGRVPTMAAAVWIRHSHVLHKLHNIMASCRNVCMANSVWQEALTRVREGFGSRGVWLERGLARKVPTRTLTAIRRSAECGISLEPRLVVREP